MKKNAESDRTERRRGEGVRYVYEILRDEIIDLTLPPGSLIDEIQLSERLSMSRTPIREALVRLAADGLVTTLPNRSTVVSNIDFLNMHHFFDAITLMYRVTTRLAAENRSDEDLALIRAHQDEFIAAVARHDAMAMIASNREFHAAIGVAGGNPYYSGLFNRLLDEGRRVLRVYYSSYNDRMPQSVIDEHEAMIRAIEDRDVAEADRIARLHADQIVGQIRRLISQDRRQDIAL
ncbi:GntR family transcriptional regulator [Paracoccus aerodenitrificans]|uniref:GntR family transcriptional regulator n=1 Tax=Paracoccus aerodenitrificans TaxID=3017781 RepID=UPI0022EFDD57|nr:GntR family transcriptional regulator [Paracoccus aerodenitrificans]WBU63731.1 GntR family transcriptional regulator [Paracoccus aerodenitrificans]